MDNFVAELKRRIRIEDVISETVELDSKGGRGYARVVINLRCWTILKLKLANLRK